MNLELLSQRLTYLQLPFARENYATLAQEAAAKQWDPLQYLDSLIQGEFDQRRQRVIQRRTKEARFPVLKTLEQFRWDWPKKINRLAVQNLFRLGFIKERANVIFLGTVGLGKTHLATALGHRAALAGVRTLFTKAVDMVTTLAAAKPNHSQHKIMKLYTHPTLLIIDELGRLSMDQEQGELLFNVIDARYERCSTVITTNRAFKDWGAIFRDMVCAKAIIDRLVHHSEVIKIEGTSHRLKDRKTKSLADAE